TCAGRATRSGRSSVAGAARLVAPPRLRLDADIAQIGAVELQCGELATPYATSVDRVHAAADEASKRRPVAADDAQLALAHARHGEPRIQPGLLGPRRPLGIKIN